MIEIVPNSIESFINGNGYNRQTTEEVLTMGRIKTKLIKRVTLSLFKQHKDEFKPEFKENKEKVAQLTDVSSKKIKNIIAGYITRLVKQKEE